VKKSPEEQRLEELERDFAPLLATAFENALSEEGGAGLDETNIQKPRNIRIVKRHVDGKRWRRGVQQLRSGWGGSDRSRKKER
jgi:hypothetical protein